MDPGSFDGGVQGGFDAAEDGESKLRTLPADLPKSLDDRRMPTELAPETELYDGWQGACATSAVEKLRAAILTCFPNPGQSQFLTSPMLARPLAFSELTLDDPNYGQDVTKSGVPDSDTRLMEMLAAQAAHSASGVLEDEDAVASNDKLSDEEKMDALQKALNMAASNGNVDQVEKVLGGKAKQYVDVNAPDEDGTPPLIYASCFVSLPLEKRGEPRHTGTRC